MLLSAAWERLRRSAVSGPHGLGLCMLQNSNVEVFLSVDFEQESLRFVFLRLLGLAGQAQALPAHTPGETPMIFLLQSSLLHTEGFCMSN